MEPNNWGLTIIAFAGRIHSGKDLAAGILHKRILEMPKRSVIVPLSRVIYDAACFGLGRTLGAKFFYGNKEALRPLLQEMGMFGRTVNGPSYWVARALDFVNQFPKEHDVGLLTGIRFQEEIDYVHRIGGKVIHMSNPKLEVVSQHPAENEAASLMGFDYRIVALSQEELEEKLMAIWPELEELICQ